MSAIETIEAIRSGLVWIGLSALAAFAVSVVGAWMYRGVASVMRCPMTVARITAFLAVSAFCVIRVGAKFLMPPPSTGGTPVVPVMQSPAAGETPVVPVVVTPEEIAQGWRQHDEKERWEHHGITSMLDTANEIFTQVGIQFELIGIPANIDRTNDWILASVDIYTNSEGKVCHTKTTSRQAAALFSEYEAAEGVTMYFVGAITNSSAVGFRSGSNVVIGKESPPKGLAHELGHYLGLKDIYYAKVGVHDGKPANIRLRIRNYPVSHESFRTETGDWGHETGRGFYASGDTLASIIGHLLMHGVVNQEQNDVGDIPDNQVYGISKDDKKGFQNVGASNFDD